MDVLNKHAPIDNIKIKGNNLPYITAKVRQLARQRDFFEKKANKTGSKYPRQIKHRVTYKLRSLKSEYYCKKIKENQGDMKGTWKILKQAMNKEAKQTDTDKILVNDEEITDKQEISEWFNDHFVTIGEKLAKGIAKLSKSSYLSEVSKNGNKFKFNMLKLTEVYTILGKLKNGKATGIHLIPNSILKTVKDIIAPSLDRHILCFHTNEDISRTHLQQIMYHAKYVWYSNSCSTFIQWCSARRSNNFHLV